MNIVENRKKFFAVPLIVILAGIIAMITNSMSGKGVFNFDIEFTGGTSMTIDIGQEFENNDVADIIEKVTGQKSPQIQKVEGTNQVSIKMQSVEGEKRTEIINGFKEKYNITDDNVLSTSDISATVSGEMQKSAILAVIISCVAMLIYISIRFKDMRAGTSAIITLMNDIFIMISFYAILRIPVNNSFIAALLTILGYSINSTIVIFDRVRENRPKFRKHQTAELINKSINQTLARSINTSLTTLFTIGAIYLFGVSSIKEFALPIVIGIISGAYSSVFVSGPIWYMLIPKNEKQ